MTCDPPRENPGIRFPFGRNWRRFLQTLDERRIQEAERSLREMLGIECFDGKRFLDVGCGSGLFSLCARRLGAVVRSFDFDPESVACAQTLKQRFFPDDPSWKIDQGSILDADFTGRLGTFDVVYAWGVLHHTGDLWRALANTTERVAPAGTLHLAVYNDQGFKSRAWRRVKRTYCSGAIGAAAVLCAFIPYLALRGLLTDLLMRKNPLSRYREYSRSRGMHLWTDWLDWLGGYPFEVSSPDAIFAFCSGRGFLLQRMRTIGGGSGNNEFVFRRTPGSAQR